KNVIIPPGVSATYDRVFVVGERADAASVIAELTRTSGGSVGAISVKLVDAKGAPVKAPVGAKVVVSDAMSIVAAKEDDRFGGGGPPGKGQVWYVPSGGRRGDGTKVDVEVKKGAVSEVTFAVSDVGAITAGCVEKERVPCKITVEGIDGTP